jgi:hypothetical protein
MYCIEEQATRKVQVVSRHMDNLMAPLSISMKERKPYDEFRRRNNPYHGF